MNDFHAFIYGLIQGLTEFLPVSSSGHLALLHHALGISAPGVLFDLMMHLGTFFAIFIYYFKDILRLIKSLFTVFNPQKRDPFLVNYVLATFSTVVPVYFLEKIALTSGRSSTYVAINSMVFGLFLYLSDKFGKHQVENQSLMHTTTQLKKSILIGLMQSIAVFPGVSRSGITITAGRFLGLSRKDAASFSFLLALPLILGGIILHLPDYATLLGNSELNHSWSLYAIGVFTSFVSGLFVIHYFLKWISKVGFLIFFIYRVFLGLIVLILL